METVGNDFDLGGLDSGLMEGYRSSSLYPGRGRIMLVDDSERLLAHYPDSDDELDEKMEI